jgi:hypothetical protein
VHSRLLHWSLKTLKIPSSSTYDSMLSATRAGIFVPPGGIDGVARDGNLKFLVYKNGRYALHVYSGWVASTRYHYQLFIPWGAIGCWTIRTSRRCNHPHLTNLRQCDITPHYIFEMTGTSHERAECHPRKCICWFSDSFVGMSTKG